MSNICVFAAAFFVQHIVASYDTHFAALNDKPDIPGDPSADDGTIGKECSNLAVLLSELYNFQVVSCVLMYDVIRALLDGDLTEFKVELLLKVARSKCDLYFHVREDSDLSFDRFRAAAQTRRPDCS